MKGGVIDKSQYCQMKVLIEATSNLSLAGENTIDAMVTVTAFGSVEYSKVRQKIGFEETVWGYHFFLTKTFQTSDYAQGQQLVIQIWDHNKVLRNSLVGSYDIDLQRVYSYKDHCLLHEWLAISNIQNDFSTITGYVKVSLVLFGENDKNIELMPEKITSITKEKRVLMPPNIERKNYQLYVEIFYGKNIKPADGSTADPFIGVYFGQIFEKTDPCMKELNPKFNLKLYIPVMLPSITDNIAFRLCDYNLVQANEIMGSYYVNIMELLDYCKQKYNPVTDKFRMKHWIHFYGPSVGASKKQQKDLYSFFPQLAPCYTGSILVRFRLLPNEKPMRKTYKIPPLYLRSPPVGYLLTTRIIAALNLNQKQKRHSVAVQLCGKYIRTNACDTQNGFCVWLVYKKMLISLYQGETMPDMFVYLLNKNDYKTCFLRCPNTERDYQLDESWRVLKPDTSIVDYYQYEAGYLKIAVNLQRLSSKEFNARPAPDMPISSNMRKAFGMSRPRGRIVVELICGQGLIPLDDEGVSDPFFSFSYNMCEQLSSVKPQTLNPVYYYRIILEADVYPNVNDQFPLIASVFDKDLTSRYFIGSTFVDLNENLKDGSVVFGSSRSPVPKWFTVTNNGVVSGKFLACFIILQDASMSISPGIDIPFEKYNIHMFMLGMRGLKSNGLIDVKRPYMEVDYESLNVYKTVQQTAITKNIRTYPKEYGPNVNIKISNSCSLYLPRDINYWPTLSARVNDYILGGVYYPILGFLSIDLKTSFLRSNKLKNDVLNETRIYNYQKPIVVRHPRLYNIDNKVLINLRCFIVSCVNYGWKTMRPNKHLNTNKNDKPMDPEYIVLLPYYREDEQKIMVELDRQYNMANEDYMCVGYDKKEMRRSTSFGKRNKHYRFTLRESYEEYYERVNKIKLGVYEYIQIRKGRLYPSKDLASNLLKAVTDDDSVTGTYKGNCYISKHIEVPSEDDLLFEQKGKKSLQNFMSNVKVYMFLYIIEGFDLPAKDLTGTSDPYLVIKVGTDTINLKSHRKLATNNPQFSQLIKKALTFPMHSSIDIQVWDYDIIKNDELIGSAVIDIENRMLAKLGSFNCNNPIYTHRLRVKQSKLNQGSIRFWLDLVRPYDIDLYRYFDISSQPYSDFELRVIVWSVYDCPCEDIEGMSDLYVLCSYNHSDQQTDVHYRSANGCGNYNWRMIFPQKLPIQENAVLSLRIYDKDFFSKDDYLCSGTFAINDLLNQAFENEESVKMYLGTEDMSYTTGVTSSSKIVDGKKMYDRFFVDLKGRKVHENAEATVENTGRIELSIEILTKADAAKRPAGLGRSDPNQHPKLPDPRGRFEFSWNPLTMISRLCGPRFRYTILCGLCIVIIIIVLYNLLYSFGGSVLANKLTG